MSAMILSGSMSLTKYYDEVVELQGTLNEEKAEKKKLEMYLNHIHKATESVL